MNLKNNKKMNKEQKISDELAEIEVLNFINNWVEKPISLEQVATDYPNILDAVKYGRLVFSEDFVPKYQLQSPIKNDSGEVSISEVEFKTRISPLNQARLAKGLNITTDQLQFLLVCVAYIIGKTVQELDKFSKKDYNTVREIASVFI